MQNSARAKILQFNQSLKLCDLCLQPRAARFPHHGLWLCRECLRAFEECREERTYAGVIVYAGISLVCWLGLLYGVAWFWHSFQLAIRIGAHGG